MSDTPARPQLGQHVRALRKERGLSIAELAERTGVSAATLSRVENEQTQISAHSLFHLANALQVDLNTFFEPDAAPMGRGARAVTARDKAVSVDTARYRAQVLCTDLANKRMHPCINEVSVRSIDEAGGLSGHEGEEFIFVLSGMLELHTDVYEPLRMEPGDSVYFDASMPHAYVCASAEPARILVVIAGGPAPAQVLQSRHDESAHEPVE